LLIRAQVIGANCGSAREVGVLRSPVASPAMAVPTV